MSEQLEKILLSSEFIKNKFPRKFKPETALIVERNFDVLSGFKILDEINFEEIPPKFEIEIKGAGKILFASAGKKDILILKGRYHFFGGLSMRSIGHVIYVLKYLGIKNILSVDEVGTLNPRYNCGDLALIYDHINLMGDNPLIGRNENKLGLRFPDMSNAYDKSLFNKIYKVLQEDMIKINESVYMGITGPQSETEAEARFYREAGADVVGYSIVPEDITAVHCGINFAAIGLITRDLVADRMLEDERSENKKNKDQLNSLKDAEKNLDKVLKKIIKEM